MSQARRTLEALQTAREHTRAANSAAGKHSNRGERETFLQDIADLLDLVEAMATLHGITSDLATVAKDCADDVRSRYIHGRTPTGDALPEPLRQAAGDADRALSKLRNHLNRTPAHGGHDTLSVLRDFIRDLHRDSKHRVSQHRGEN